MKRVVHVGVLLALALLCIAQGDGVKKSHGEKYSLVILYFDGIGYACEIVPDGEVGKLKKLVRAEHKKTREAWKKARKEAKENKEQFTKPKPPKPSFKLYKKGLFREDCEKELQKLKNFASSAITLLNNWRDAYRKLKTTVDSERLRKPGRPKGRHVSVLTYNVNYAMPEPKETLKAILESKADVIFLQETNEKWEKLLRRKLKEKYPHSLFRYPTGKFLAAGQAIFSMHKVREIKFIKSSVGWFPAWLLEVDTPIGKMQVLALHLKPVTRKNGRRDAAAVEETMEVHLKEIGAFYPSVKKDAPTLVLGDLNEGDSGDTAKWLKDQGFTDALPEFDRKTPTWRWKVGKMPLKERPDHILYSKHLHCYEAKVMEKGGSDHYPVLAGFQKKNRSGADK